MSATTVCTALIPADQIVAIQSFAKANGPRWKSALLAAFETGADAREPMGDALRRFRNAYGPSVLARVRNPARLAPLFATISREGTVQSDGWTLAEVSERTGIRPEVVIEETEGGESIDARGWCFAREDAAYPCLCEHDDPIHDADD